MDSLLAGVLFLLQDFLAGWMAGWCVVWLFGCLLVDAFVGCSLVAVWELSRFIIDDVQFVDLFCEPSRCQRSCHRQKGCKEHRWARESWDRDQNHHPNLSRVFIT